MLCCGGSNAVPLWVIPRSPGESVAPERPFPTNGRWFPRSPREGAGRRTGRLYSTQLHGALTPRGQLRRPQYRIGRPLSPGSSAASSGSQCHEGRVTSRGTLDPAGTARAGLRTALGVEACGRGKRVRFHKVIELVTQMIEAQEQRQLGRLKTQLSKLDLLILDELGYVPTSKLGAELLFDVISTAYEQTSVIVTSNLPFENWTEVLGSERLTGATLDRLTHRCHIIECNGESYRLREVPWCPLVSVLRHCQGRNRAHWPVTRGADRIPFPPSRRTFAFRSSSPFGDEIRPGSLALRICSFFKFSLDSSVPSL